MNISAHTGFSAPVFDSQIAFRSIMNAMARPASYQPVPVDLTPPEGLPVAAAAALLALCDFETALWVSPGLENALAIQDYLAFYTGTKRAQKPNEAQFAVLNLDDDDLHLDAFAQGTAEYPDRSTTLITIAPSLIGGPIRHLKGPGIKDVSPFAVAGLPIGFEEQWAANHAAFPLGVDMIFCSGKSLLALPRSTRIMKGL